MESPCQTWQGGQSSSFLIMPPSAAFTKSLLSVCLLQPTHFRSLKLPNSWIILGLFHFTSGAEFCFHPSLIRIILWSLLKCLNLDWAICGCLCGFGGHFYYRHVRFGIWDSIKAEVHPRSPHSSNLPPPCYWLQHLAMREVISLSFFKIYFPQYAKFFTNTVERIWSFNSRLKW